MVRNPADDASSKENGADSQNLILIRFENVYLVNDSEEQTPPGTLNITPESLRWESESAPSLTINFADINLHAISTDASNGFPPSIYAQTGDDFREIRMIPEESRLQELYNALCEGVVRNEDSTSEDMGVLSMGEDSNEQT
ncbi:PH-like protein [Gracilaria domingensis]|nr:PH-like protein [Gracilaria domingensis]